MAEILRRGITDVSFQFSRSRIAEDLFFWNVTLRHIPEERVLRMYTRLLRRTAITLAQFLQREFTLLGVTASNRRILFKNTFG
jgi:hypothetical protein